MDHATYSSFFAAAMLALTPASVLAQSYAGFVPQPTVSVISSANSIVSADFDHDGDPDFAIVRRDAAGGGHVFILRNNGRGVLVVAQDTPVGFLPSGLAVGDLDQDGNADLITAVSGSDDVNIIYSRADGTFEPPLYVSTGINQPSSVTLEDFDTNGFLDIAVVSEELSLGAVLLGNGKGFTPAPPFSTRNQQTFQGRRPVSVAAGDLNADGNPDLVTGNITFDDVGIFYGLGNGSFFTGDFAFYLDQPADVHETELVDVDRDGDLDIVFSYGFTGASVVWASNDYNGGAEVFPDFSEGSWSTLNGGRVVGLAAGDLDCGGDAFTDFVAVDEYMGGSLRVLTNSGSGPLNGRSAIPHETTSPKDAAVVDVDGDGDSDIVVCSLGGEVQVFLSRCTGTNCPADLSGDGVLNFFDISSFIVSFSANDPVADIASPAGAWNFFDISNYIDAWSRGCP
ncbi:MAG: VCBS repeat-containing protein [Phycisphaerales bacterium]